MTKIDIKGDIVDNDTGEFFDYFGMSSVYPKKVQQAIENDEDEEIILDVASNGGDVFSASEIYTMLKSSGKNIVVNIQGLAASAASVISMAGNTVNISPTAQLMIHKASVIGAGNADDFEHEAKVLNGIDESIASAYELKTGMKQEDLLQMMASETWLNAKEAVDKGFADNIMFSNNEDEEIVITNSINHIPSKQAINKFKNLIAKEQLKNEKDSQPKISLRDQKLAILRAN
ncbi:head maturation protease, ClpP-related [Streptococcus parauberis]|uniref:head maturation protease, ClpP-related n=1 Tax=Streptococcus parauberis TaxID=1348 RepID=UPI000789BD09|nr:head maturation protease, ClpP-related [Streptococcus parauberis]QBX18158.1 Clp protease-like protein [Streptococcus phage Javan399]KYP20786.1 ATP-dependent Clp protease proteolytic subunit 1 [Streptococcus parauberis]KYP21170.1 ATP-dependent Clp protease proteolytic subunit 1 [Streptococcus parauberis]KYP22434.1 ATP-dependent Clp protease proteolytic subunit 1 [Streptococcus parauberis]KYP24829.1 ATP-dependent Clp protease proteolytic subunit 1 [Streptococcus parauberis]